MYDYLQTQIQQVYNNAMSQNYQTLLRSMDYRMQLTWDTHYACCDAYHISHLPDYIKCNCMLGVNI